LNLRAHADSGITYAEHRVGPRAGAWMRLDEGAVELDVRGLDGEPTTLRHRVPGIDGEVQDDLLDLRRVGLDAAEGRVEQGDQLDRLADQRLEHLRHAGHDPVEVEHARLEHLLAAEREALLSERRRAIRRFPDQLDAAPEGPELVLRGDRVAAQAGRAGVFEARHVSRLDPAAGVEADELAGGAVAEHPCERRVDEQRDPVALDVDALDRALDQGAIAPLALALDREELSVPDGDAGLVGEAC